LPELTKDIEMFARSLVGVQRHFGHLDEPLKGISAAQFQLRVIDDDETTKTVGAIIGMNRRIQLTIGTTVRQFDLPWAVAAANRCLGVCFSFNGAVRGKSACGCFGSR